MNNRKEQIIRYLDGNMGEDEKLHFEKILAKDTELQQETGQVKKLLSSMKDDAGPDTDETYFVNMVPEFYIRYSKKKKFIFSKLAYSLSTAAAIILILVIIFRPAGTIKQSTLNELTANLSESELNETLKQYADRYSLNDLMNSASAKTDSIVTDMVANELDLSGIIDKTVADKYINTDELISSMNETEANELYSQLINEDIIKGVK